MNKQGAYLYENTQPYYGSIRLIEQYATFKDAVVAGLRYRKQNPTANTLEIYCYDNEGATHSMENTFYWTKIVEH
jgi:hypothetical protein